ncbi:MAG: hydroxymethylglutaryl-CoA lyase [Pseudomonadota bacterium]|nr:hydroxymethylglutaryl-CoA lyase [Pseudomonadota bacterium]
MVNPYEGLPEAVTIVEVGPRDGWQNLSEFIPTEQKIVLINALSACGFAEIEVSSFVSPRAIPQLRDADQVFAAIDRVPGTVYSALVPNQRGLKQALTAGVDKVAFFISASETHNRENIGQSIAETTADIEAMLQKVPASLGVRVSISNVFGCPYEGNVPVNQVADLLKKIIAWGVEEITLCDTWGVATPGEIFSLLKYLDDQDIKSDFGLHLHDSSGRALAGVIAGLQWGITRFDTALGGLGGCPFAPGAAGNLATEDLVFCLEEMGVKTGISQDLLLRAANMLEKNVHHLASHMIPFFRGCQSS